MEHALWHRYCIQVGSTERICTCRRSKRKDGPCSGRARSGGSRTDNAVGDFTRCQTIGVHKQQSHAIGQSVGYDLTIHNIERDLSNTTLLSTSTARLRAPHWILLASVERIRNESFISDCWQGATLETQYLPLHNFSSHGTRNKAIDHPRRSIDAMVIRQRPRHVPAQCLLRSQDITSCSVCREMLSIRAARPCQNVSTRHIFYAAGEIT